MSTTMTVVRYLYPTSDIQYLTSARARARARDIRRLKYISDVGYRYRTSDIDIGRQIYILDVLYIYNYWTSDIDWKYWCHFVLNGASYLILSSELFVVAFCNVFV